MAGIANSDVHPAKSSASSAPLRFTSTIEDIYPPLPSITAPIPPQHSHPAGPVVVRYPGPRAPSSCSEQGSWEPAGSRSLPEESHASPSAPQSTNYLGSLNSQPTATTPTTTPRDTLRCAQTDLSNQTVKSWSLG
ncbi:hypothetical protein PCASD_04582 [Puccinia coronata f. sp. avenae]|uniref:Uncharacterized protein n=1 Tax=Puccinia coronata f. sp. avenae TaxID=200324 RepID=A0A2N5V566_9BASI|nr:hypothetical protein PCASD_04582 [Puccinia coronata f. sp. avenae]